MSFNPSIEYGLAYQTYKDSRDLEGPSSPHESSEGEKDIRQDEKEQYLGDAPGGNVNQLNSGDDAKVEVEKSIGVAKIEALYLVFGKGWKLWTLWGSIGLLYFVYSLSGSTTYVYEAFAASAFGEHSLIGTIQTITAIMAGVSQPFIAKIADNFSRPIALAAGVLFYAIGYAMTAGANDIQTVAAGQVIYTLGNTGISVMTTILIGDMTNLENRGLVNGIVSLPYIPNAFIAGFISSGISAYSNGNGWRWGYGMFAILVPVCIAPTLFVLFWGDRRATQVGAVSLASSSQARRVALEGIDGVAHKGWGKTAYEWSGQIDAFGLLLMGFAFALLLAPATLSNTAIGGYKNPSLIAMLAVGAVLFVAWIVWEARFASHPIMPMRVLNKTFIMCCIIDFMYFFSYYISGLYYFSWVFIVKDWSANNYTYFTNISTVCLCLFAVPAGLIQKYTHRYKYLQIFGCCLRTLGIGFNFLAVNGNMNAIVLIMAQIISCTGGAISVIASQTASQGSVPHNDMAIAISVLALWTQVGGSIASAIAASVWTEKVPANLDKYLGGIYNSTELAEVFGSIVVARAIPERDLIRQAYVDSFWGLSLASLLTSFLPIIAACFTTNYYLGKTHNAIESTEIVFRGEDETRPEVIAAKAKEVEERYKQEALAARN